MLKSNISLFSFKKVSHAAFEYLNACYARLVSLLRPRHWQMYYTQWLSLQHFSAQVRQRLAAERASQTAGSLTFTTVLALVPLATVMLAVFTAFPAFEKLRLALEDYFIESLMPRQVASVVTSYLTMFASKARSLSLMGAGFLLVTVVAMFLTIERTLNAIWQVPQRHSHRGRWFLDRALAYWAVLTVAPFALGAGFYATAQLIASTRGLSVGLSEAAKLFMVGLPIALSTGMWTLVFKTMPNTHVRWQHAAIGAVFSSVLLALLKELFVVYLAKYANFKELYGAFSVVPVLLIWLYLAWGVTLLGAAVAALLPSWGTRYASDQTFTQPLMVKLRVLRALAQAHSSAGAGGALSLELIQKNTFLPAHATQTALLGLQHLGWIGQLKSDSPEAGNAWVLLRRLDEISVQPLLNTLWQAGTATRGSVWQQRWLALGSTTVSEALVLLEVA